MVVARRRAGRARHGSCGRQEGALQGGDELLEAGALALGFPAGPQQLTFVGAAVASRRRPSCGSRMRFPGSIGLDHRSDQHGQPRCRRRPAGPAPPRGPRPAWLTRGARCGLVVDPAPDRQQVGEVAAARPARPGVYPSQASRVALTLARSARPGGWTGNRRARSRTGPRALSSRAARRRWSGRSGCPRQSQPWGPARRPRPAPGDGTVSRAVHGGPQRRRPAMAARVASGALSCGQ